MHDGSRKTSADAVAELGESAAEGDPEFGAGQAEVVLDVAYGLRLVTVEPVARGDDRAFERIEVVEQMGTCRVQAHEVVVRVGADVRDIFQMVQFGVGVGIRPTFVAGPRVVGDPRERTRHGSVVAPAPDAVNGQRSVTGHHRQQVVAVALELHGTDAGHAEQCGAVRGAP